MSGSLGWWTSGAIVLGLGLLAAVAWLVFDRTNDEQELEVRDPTAEVRGRPAAATGSEPSASSQLPAVTSKRPLPSNAAAGSGVLARGRQTLAVPDGGAAPLPPWRRPMKPASKDWAKDPRLVQLNENVKAELEDIEDWFQRHPAMPQWSQVGPERMKRVKKHSANLGQRVISGECRLGVCRLEVEHDPTAKNHARVRPEPRIRRHPDGSVMVRLTDEESIRTIYFLVRDEN